MSHHPIIPLFLTWATTLPGTWRGGRSQDYIGVRPLMADSSIPGVAYSNCEPTAKPRAGLVIRTPSPLSRLSR